jgi:GTP cyclohydrolase I
MSEENKMNCDDEPIYVAADLICDKEMDLDTIEKSVAKIIKAVGEDPEREGLLNTPRRVAKAYVEVDYDDMVIVRDIEFYSLCEHHMLPFLGRAHVAYIPDGKVIGLSKIPRIVDMFARRLQVQERMTRQIADYVNEILHPRGVAVVVEGMHLCAMIRGVRKHDSRMTTSSMLGAFRKREATRMEFLDNISRGASPLHF